MCVFKYHNGNTMHQGNLNKIWFGDRIRLQLSRSGKNFIKSYQLGCHFQITVKLGYNKQHWTVQMYLLYTEFIITRLINLVNVDLGLNKSEKFVLVINGSL
jgi:hypothetical protein